MKKAKNKKLSEAEKKEKIAAALLRKKACESKALEIVTRLSEETPSRDWFKEACVSLNQDYYDDIITERSVVRLCGYGICGKTLQKSSSAKYHVSLRDKKVYSTEERQKFCSGFCFKASNFLKSQLDVSPVWIREANETVAVKFLEADSPASLNLSGKGEVIELVGTVKLPPDDDLARHVVVVENHDGDEDVSIRDACLPHDEVIPVKKNARKPVLKPATDEKKKKVCFETEYSGVRDAVQEVPAEKQLYQEAKNSLMQTKEGSASTAESRLTSAEKVREVLTAWWTADSDQLIDSTDAIVDEDEDDVEAEVEELSEKTTSLSITPDPKVLVDPQLIRETEQYKLKFGAYLKGKEVYEETPILIKENEDSIESLEPRLPLLDRHSQLQLRVRIVLDQIEREIPDLLEFLGVPRRLALEELRRLVRTFDLRADNITFKPVEWRLLSLVLLSVIYKANPEMCALMGSEDGKKKQSLLLEQFALEHSFCDYLVIDLRKKSAKTSEN